MYLLHKIHSDKPIIIIIYIVRAAGKDSAGRCMDTSFTSVFSCKMHTVLYAVALN